MALSETQKHSIRNLLQDTITKKLNSYGRETKSIPFLDRLIQDGEKVAAYSFIHSIATSLGQSIFEKVSAIIAEDSADIVESSHEIGGTLSDKQNTCITNIIKDLRSGARKADIAGEADEILQISAENGKFQKEGNKVDFYMLREGQEYFFEIKTVKPNIDTFNKSKTKLLEWIARKRKPVKVFLAFPYNPYHPEPYTRFTITGMMDHPNDFLIGEEYWDFLGGQGSFTELLDIFDEVGKKFKAELNQKFKEIAEKNNYNP